MQSIVQGLTSLPLAMGPSSSALGCYKSYTPAVAVLTLLARRVQSSALIQQEQQQVDWPAAAPQQRCGQAQGALLALKQAVHASLDAGPAAVQDPYADMALGRARRRAGVDERGS